MLDIARINARKICIIISGTFTVFDTLVTFSPMNLYKSEGIQGFLSLSSILSEYTYMYQSRYNIIIVERISPLCVL